MKLTRHAGRCSSLSGSEEGYSSNESLDSFVVPDSYPLTPQQESDTESVRFTRVEAERKEKQTQTRKRKRNRDSSMSRSNGDYLENNCRDPLQERLRPVITALVAVVVSEVRGQLGMSSYASSRRHSSVISDVRTSQALSLDTSNSASKVQGVDISQAGKQDSPVHIKLEPLSSDSDEDGIIFRPRRKFKASM